MLTVLCWTEAEHAALVAHDPTRGWVALGAALGRTPKQCWERYRRLARFRRAHGRWPALDEMRVSPRASSFAPWSAAESDRLCEAACELVHLHPSAIARLLAPDFPGRTVEAVRQQLVLLDPLDRRND